MRKIAVDIGDVRVGIAMSDPLGILVSSCETIILKQNLNIYKYIANLCEKNNVDTIVLGLPKNMDGSEGIRAEKSYDFGTNLKNYLPSGVNITYLDERLTSVQAERVLIGDGVRRKNRKEVIDKIAASIILQTYLDKTS